MEYFERLGQVIEARWSALHHDEDAFPEVALAALREMPPADHLQPMDVVDWVLTVKNIPRQAPREFIFGEPNLQVFFGPENRFYVEVLFWLDGTTSIHQHGFSGAFSVLAGSSIHSKYRFTGVERINSGFKLGDLEVEYSEYLRAGDARPIHSEDRLIHSLFHLDRPSVTVSVRTPHDRRPLSNYVYMPPCLGVDSGRFLPALSRRLEMLRALERLEHPAHDERLHALLRETDIEEGYTLVHDFLMRLHHGPRRRGWRQRFDAAVDAFRARHGRLGERVASVFPEQIRQWMIIERRATIQNPHHRFLLALILNLSDRQRIFEFIRSAFPQGRPEDLIVEWVGAMSAGEDGGGLGIPFDAAALTILHGALRDDDVAAIQGTLRQKLGEVDAEEIVGMLGALRASPLLAPLLRAAQ
jgi:hypothetical protein